MSNPKIFLQPELIEGDNIDIAQDGKTISSNTPLENITDTDITEVEDGQALIYDETSGKWVNGEGGTPIEPNPAAAATDTLSTIKIDNTVFTIGGGGTGDAVLYPLTTAEYNALTPEQKMDENVLYLLTDGGSGGGSNKKDILWTSPTSSGTYGVDLSLAHPYTDYDYLIFTMGHGSGTNARYVNTYVSIETLEEVRKGERTGLFTAIEYGNGYHNYSVTSTSLLQYRERNSSVGTLIFQVQGIKFGGGGGSSEVNYSTEEQRIGTWIDGKPLYQKTVEVTSITRSAWNSYLVDADAVIKNIEGWYADANNRLPLNYFTGSVMLNRTSDHADGYFSLYGSGTISTATVTVKYTKTTD